MLGEELVGIIYLGPCIHESFACGFDCLSDLLVVGGIVAELLVRDYEITSDSQDVCEFCDVGFVGSNRGNDRHASSVVRLEVVGFQGLVYLGHVSEVFFALKLGDSIYCGIELTGRGVGTISVWDGAGECC